MRIIGNDPSTPRQTQVVASGTLSTGDAVVVNSDGTVSVVGASSTLGLSTTEFQDNNTTQYVSSVYDVNAERVVIAYLNNDTSNGTGGCIVGTISGSSISFGSFTTFSTGTQISDISLTYDSTNNKCVVSYQFASGTGQSKVATVDPSDNSITFGSAAQYSSEADQITSIFDDSSGKVVLAFRSKEPSTEFDILARVGTVSGTSISWGTAATVSSVSSQWVSLGNDIDSNKIVFAYLASSEGKSKVGTVSGTTISFGSEATFTANATYISSMAYHDALDKMILTYRDSGNSNYPTSVVGTVSGTSISFGTPVVLNSAYGGTSKRASAYDPVNQKVFTVYGPTGGSIIQDLTASGTTLVKGTEIALGQEAAFQCLTYISSLEKMLITYKGTDNDGYASLLGFLPNLTSENYIGTAASGAADTQRAKINLKGAVADVPARGFNVAGASFDSVSFSVASQDTNPNGITFNNNGTKMYIVGTTGDSVYQYTLSTAFDLSTASYDSVSFSVASQDLTPNGVAFNNDGTKMYIAGDGNNQIYQYSLSTAFDLSTASYDSVSLDISSQDSAPTGVVFNSDGTKMYIAGGSNDNIYQYSLSTGFDLSTASYDSVSFNTTSQGQPQSLIFNGAGTKMYILMAYGTTGVAQYSLSTAFDLSTASYDSVSFGVSSQETERTGLAANSDGTKMYVVGVTNDSVHQYSTSASLTAGQSYYVQTDGTLGTTPADPSVFAGTAVAATKLIVKG